MANTENSSSELTLTRAQLVTMTFMVEGAMLVIAVLIALWRDVIFWDVASMSGLALVIGIASAIPPLVIVIVATESNTKIGERARADFSPVIELFREASILDLLFVSAMAGLCEEALFRGAMQTWAAEHWGTGVALAVVSLLFGLAHFLSWSYMIFATAIGVYFGLLYIWTGSLLAPMVGHAVYDFVALIYGTRFMRNRI